MHREVVPGQQRNHPAVARSHAAALLDERLGTLGRVKGEHCLAGGDVQPLLRHLRGQQQPAFLAHILRQHLLGLGARLPQQAATPCAADDALRLEAGEGTHAGEEPHQRRRCEAHLHKAQHRLSGPGGLRCKDGGHESPDLVAHQVGQASPALDGTLHSLHAQRLHSHITSFIQVLRGLARGLLPPGPSDEIGAVAVEYVWTKQCEHSLRNVSQAEHQAAPHVADL
mmetsp:Transcript_39678/g.112566  ORF Transcript_39678/g.112566 Transcript_39678/m.112566 type:complete len:226 (+) Transcript_39678:2162-2839(+)